MDDRERLVGCFLAAVEAALPGPAVARALETAVTEESAPVVVAVGKAAVPMAQAAERFLTRRGRRPGGGLVVTHHPAPLAHLPVIVGEHPLPGAGSRRAAEELATLCRTVSPGTPVWFLLSGGATSLLGGPDEGVAVDDLAAAWETLLTSGLDITAMNSVRKRLTRWGGGRLARALGHTTILQLIVSDVIGNALPSIGSGPLVPDPLTAARVVETLRDRGVWDRLPGGVRAHLAEMATGRRPDTPPAEDPAFGQVHSMVIVSNEAAMAAAAVHARSLGWDPVLAEQPLEGEASAAGGIIAEAMRSHGRHERPTVLIHGGETTVTIQPGAAGRGGRAQELALAAAGQLAGGQDGFLLLAAGTDGRDGPTDAAGAVVDERTWARIRAAGLDPGRALEHHDAYPALAAAGALLRTGPTGTNVMDLVLGLVPAAGAQGRMSSGGR